MVLEIIVNRYVVIESTVLLNHDSPVIGAYETVPLDKVEHGSFDSKIEAKKYIAGLIVKREEDGWKESADKSFLYKDKSSLEKYFKVDLRQVPLNSTSSSQ